MPQTEMKVWIALARDAEGIHCYRMTFNTSSIHQATVRFRHIAKEQGWEPFQHIELFMVRPEPQNETFSKVAFFSTNA